MRHVNKPELFIPTCLPTACSSRTVHHLTHPEIIISTHSQLAASTLNWLIPAAFTVLMIIVVINSICSSLGSRPAAPLTGETAQTKPIAYFQPRNCLCVLNWARMHCSIEQASVYSLSMKSIEDEVSKCMIHELIPFWVEGFCILVKAKRLYDVELIHLKDWVCFRKKMICKLLGSLHWKEECYWSYLHQNKKLLIKCGFVYKW